MASVKMVTPVEKSTVVNKLVHCEVLEEHDEWDGSDGLFLFYRDYTEFGKSTINDLTEGAFSRKKIRIPSGGYIEINVEG